MTYCNFFVPTRLPAHIVKVNIVMTLCMTYCNFFVPTRLPAHIYYLDTSDSCDFLTHLLPMKAWHPPFDPILRFVFGVALAAGVVYWILHLLVTTCWELNIVVVIMIPLEYYFVASRSST